MTDMETETPHVAAEDVLEQPSLVEQHHTNGTNGANGGNGEVDLEQSATARAEKVEKRAREGDANGEPLAKKLKGLENTSLEQAAQGLRIKGVAPIKKEYLLEKTSRPEIEQDQKPEVEGDDRDKYPGGKKDKKDKLKGQNTKRTFGSSRDALPLCATRAYHSEFSAPECQYGESCRFEHDLRKYLKEGKRGDLDTFGSVCPVFEAHGRCPAGWRCRFAGSHSKEVEREDGRKELVLLPEDSDHPTKENEGEEGFGIINIVPSETKINLRKKKIFTPKADAYTEWLNEHHKEDVDFNPNKPVDDKDAQAAFVDPPFLPSEKRKLYYGPETPILAPLTTQGNLPFRRLAVELGAQVTWSEMAMGLPLIQGEKNEWALLKAHASELSAPNAPSAARYESSNVVEGYDRSQDFRFGAQIASNKPWLANKTCEILTELCPRLRAIDLNCGCPIDLVYRQGAGSALLDSPSKLEKMLRGMSAVSKDVPVTAKIRMGTRDNKPTAQTLVRRLAFGGPGAQRQGFGPCGIAAITLHGRSRQQRYTKSADWGYIAECAALIAQHRDDEDMRIDTSGSSDDERRAPNGGKLYFIGNGDCYSHEDYFNSIRNAGVDSVLIARGALIKPWIFEEIAAGQYLDKSASERLGYVEKFARYGLEAWGSDEVGVGITRRFLLEWLSFACRYVPVGLLEYLPPQIQDRPPAYRGRNELETLMASESYKDWIKISEMFLGPAHKDFHFVPKHKSSMVESDIATEG